MKQMIYKLTMTTIMTVGLFVGMVKGQEARTRWINKMKGRLEASEKQKPNPGEVILDEIEMAAFHNN